MKYQASIDLRQKNNSHTLAYDLVRQNTAKKNLRVLEVGCASGYWGALLRAEGCFVVGVEPDEDAAGCARNVLDEVFVGGIDGFLEIYSGEMFDVICFVDVLEHTPKPSDVLSKCQRLLNSDGIIVCSIPNVAHLSVRAMVLAGKWEYSKTGLLDNSHIVFFTKNTIIDMLTQSGLKILDMQATVMDAGAASKLYGTYSPFFLRTIAALVAKDCCWQDFQYVVCVKKEGSAGVSENIRFYSVESYARAFFFKIEFIWKYFGGVFFELCKKMLKRK